MAGRRFPAYSGVMKARWMAFFFAVVCAEADPDRTFHAYPIGFGDPAAMETMARAIVKEGGAVTVDPEGRRLLVLGTAEEHRQLEALTRSAQTPPRQVRIEVQFSGAVRTTDQGASPGLSGAVVIDRSGAKGGVALRPSVLRRTTEIQTGTRQSLLVSSGRSASLRVGESVPHLEWLMQCAAGWGYVAEARMRWQEVGAFLSIEPTVVGEGAQSVVRVRVVPELSGFVDGRPHRVRFLRASTEVVARSGETVRIGGLGQDRDFNARFLVGFDRNNVRESADILLTPTVVEPGGSAPVVPLARP